MSHVAAELCLFLRHRRSPAALPDEAVQMCRSRALEMEGTETSFRMAGDDRALFATLRDLFRIVAHRRPVEMSVLLSNLRAGVGGTASLLTFRPIAFVENDARAPAAPEAIEAMESRIVLDVDLAEGLMGMEPGRPVMVVFSFHRAHGSELLQHPRGDEARPLRGVFALRSPHRPNPIGVSVANLISIKGNVLRLRGLDCIDGTPVLDLKPG